MKTVRTSTGDVWQLAMRPAAKGFRSGQQDTTDFSTLPLPRVLVWLGVLVPTAVAVLSAALAMTIWLVNASTAYTVALVGVALVAYGVRLWFGPWTVHATPLQSWKKSDGESWFEHGWRAARRRKLEVERELTLL